MIEEEERELIHSVMEFGDTIVREVMKPRPEMVAVSVDDSPRRVLDVVIAEGYSKLPVYQESKDDIVGVVHDRELLVALANGSLAHASVRALMRPAVHVPETKKIAELLREMQRDKFSLAIVVDEYGGTAGLVTMEDLLEEIVGEIRDEHDVDEQEPIAIVSTIAKRSSKPARTSRTSTRGSASQLPTEDFETIGGYTVGLFGRLPKEGEEIDAADHMRLRVDRTRGRRILAVRIYTNGSIRPDARNRRTPTQPRAYKTRGVVLRGRQLGEADRIRDALHAERGKLDAVAKGVRRPRSHFAGRLEFLNECDFLMHRGRSLDVIVSAEIVERAVVAAGRAATLCGGRRRRRS